MHAIHETSVRFVKKAVGGGGSSAKGVRVEASKARGRRYVGRGYAPSPENFGFFIPK